MKETVINSRTTRNVFQLSSSSRQSDARSGRVVFIQQVDNIWKFESINDIMIELTEIEEFVGRRNIFLLCHLTSAS